MRVKNKTILMEAAIFEEKALDTTATSKHNTASDRESSPN